MNNVVYSTFKEACNASGLLEGDNEWHEALIEAATWANAVQMRNLFVTLLLFCEVSNPKELWERHWKELSEDIVFRQQQQRCTTHNLTLSDNQIQTYTLCEIEQVLNRSHHSLQ